MILLDTNYLIRALVPDSVESERIVDWFQAGENLCTSSIAWYEFLCGPVDDEGVLVVQSLLQERILPYTTEQAAESARLFNVTGRKRHLRVDAMIAAAAIVTGAELAISNTGHFEEFRKFGLKLAG
jgi:predicted nucleic acid-binding protein